jgi:hypothetical protein
MPRVAMDLPDSSSHLHYPQIVFRTFTPKQSLSTDLPLASLCEGYLEVCMLFLWKRTDRDDHLHMIFQDKKSSSVLSTIIHKSQAHH